MIAIDTNILMRYFTQDDEVQSALASKIIEKYAGRKSSLFINNIVLCELVWNLKSRLPKGSIIDLLKRMLATEEFAFEDRNLLWEALEVYETKNCDFADVVICKFNSKKYKYVPTITFDKRAAAIKECKLVD